MERPFSNGNSEVVWLGWGGFSLEGFSRGGTEATTPMTLQAWLILHPPTEMDFHTWEILGIPANSIADPSVLEESGIKPGIPLNLSDGGIILFCQSSSVLTHFLLAAVWLSWRIPLGPAGSDRQSLVMLSTVGFQPPFIPPLSWRSSHIQRIIRFTYR